MSDFFEEREQEYREALARQAQERRKEAQAERAKVKKEADKIYDALLDAFPAPETPAIPERPFLDMVRDNSDSLTPQQRERFRIEDYHARRAALMESERKQRRREDNDELGVNRLKAADIDLDGPEFDDEDEYYDED